MGHSVLKHLRFKLSFDDPRLNETQWIAVTGNRAQLQALNDAVTSYVQKFLSQSRETLSQSAGQATTIDAEPTTNVIPEKNSAGIFLQPKGILSHELHLGTLATEQSGPTIRLSAVQLADLASALDEYSTDVTALPNLERSRWGNTTPAWGTIAAAAVVTIGLAAFVARVLEPSTPQPETAASQGASSNDQRLAVQPLPNNPVPSPLATLPSAPLPLTSASPNPTASAQPGAPVPGAPAQLPNLTVSQQPPVDAPPPQINMPVREVPVSAIPNQASGAAAPSSAASSSASNSASSAAARPGNPTAKTAPNPNADATESAPEVAISPPAQADRSALQAPAPAITAPGNQRSTASLPQVAEVKSFFESQWQPPKELTESIEYRLVLAPDGTLQTFTPLGRTADLFLDRTPMPFTGQKFVSPIKGGGTPTIRLVLSPDGKVQTFLEAP